uniref:Amine oxidase domain-containing protein n=1 Tax=Timspurckia oligopyrenoides TaxID=708627 RepID=A0A7S1EV51_9RHOD|mmetsp:Transcript_9952/g.17924  ORF Transcript_9952/g.17924 Transcript_9952/m.17924 type:complete len:561 (+) Transcript_9952:111-1793(+)|eukprot:CAMPEP_0182447498 /NCGR_PEP_ID=MMETSP1172-20130603/16709_1 /TAXON_ID=708627 /ORGANISM="Timspurckia oligopyrenoides, Strain CCMP3278" /LENGTH=560 /DNA_ID=CAMNT_0024643957 /DNA_START=61 /DNA_END=1743 /DNA_ORIENTATION=+
MGTEYLDNAQLEGLRREAAEAHKLILEYMKIVQVANHSAMKPLVVAVEQEHVEASKPVSIHYTVDGESYEKEFDAVLVACQPAQLDGAMEFTDREKASFDKLEFSWFFTTLVRANKPATPEAQRFSEVMSWSAALTGNIQNCREEFNARNPGPYIPDEVKKTYYTVYQQRKALFAFENVEQVQADLEQIRDATLSDEGNAFFLQDAEYVGSSLMASYFPHFNANDIEHLWNMYNLQGLNNTFYISSAMCFESILHVYEYGRSIFEKVRRTISPDKKIAIIGAGPAGLLWASLFLKEYADVTIFEKSNRYGGNTRTERHRLSDGTEVVCELGACYLSAKYAQMLQDFKEAGLFKGNREVLMGKYPREDNEDADESVFGRYNTKSSQLEWRMVVQDGIGQEYKAFTEPILSFESVHRYKELHEKIMGHVRPIPRSWDTIPPEYRADLRLTFVEFLEKHGFSMMINPLLYAYQHQGYGKLTEIPALYGLIWVTPEAFFGILSSGFLRRPFHVFCLKDGWIRIWDNAVQISKDRVAIELNAQVKKIVRRGKNEMKKIDDFGEEK